MGTFIGGIIGFGAGLWLSVMFIFPDHALRTPLSAMTLGYILRILGGLIVTLVGGGIGGSIGAVIGNYIDEMEPPRSREEQEQETATIRKKVDEEFADKRKKAEEEKVKRFFGRLDEEEAVKRSKKLKSMKKKLERELKR
jgi:hypothetical protein